MDPFTFVCLCALCKRKRQYTSSKDMDRKNVDLDEPGTLLNQTHWIDLPFVVFSLVHQLLS